MKCLVKDCQLHGDSGFYKLPTEEKTRKIWIQQLKLSEWFLTTEKKFRVCFRHFSKEAFKTSGKYVTLKKGTFYPF